MKRRQLLRHLRGHGCELLREGGNHSWWHNPAQNRRFAIPRYTEISDILANNDDPEINRNMHEKTDLSEDDLVEPFNARNITEAYLSAC